MPEGKEPPKWWRSGSNLYNGDDTGSLVAECASAKIAMALLTAANADPELRRRIRDAK